jgi:hypothetical protein
MLERCLFVGLHTLLVCIVLLGVLSCDDIGAAEPEPVEKRTKEPFDSDLEMDDGEPVDVEARDTEPFEPQDESLPSAWPCPTVWDAYRCVASHAECDALEGQVSSDYTCDEEAGSLCCNSTPIIVEGPYPCPESEPGISCQFSWECYKAGGELLYENFYCTGDNALCCGSDTLDQASDGALGPEDP